MCFSGWKSLAPGVTPGLPRRRDTRVACPRCAGRRWTAAPARAPRLRLPGLERPGAAGSLERPAPGNERAETGQRGCKLLGATGRASKQLGQDWREGGGKVFVDTAGGEETKGAPCGLFPRRRGASPGHWPLSANRTFGLAHLGILLGLGLGAAE